ncbi:MAG: IPT/TIG domain-containing protein [Deltaproteobacteria bacterium]|nr:IPT/TIG domain-containing protein [Deltaproteobacteria bacterium]
MNCRIILLAAFTAALCSVACNLEIPSIPTADSQGAAEAGAGSGGPQDGSGSATDGAVTGDSGAEASGAADAAPGSDVAAAADADAGPQDIQVDPATATADIGAAGGTLNLPSGAQLTIPPGALAGNVQISIGAVVPPSAEQLKGSKAVGAALVLEPEGQQFLLPIEVRLPLDSKIAGSVDWGGAKLLIAPKGSSAFVTLDSTFSQDAKGAFVTAQITHFSWVVPAMPPPGAVFITTKTLAAGTVGVGWGPAQFTATGGQPPYAWSAPAGGLPPGFELSPTGALSGMPTTAGSFAFSVRATDAAGTLVEKAFSLVIAAPKPTVTWLQPPQVPQGSPETTVTVTGTNFVQGSVAYWNTAATPLPTVFVAADKLQVTLAASLLLSPGKALVFVKNPDGTQANGYNFDVTYVAQNPLPKLTKVTPASLAVGGADTQISVLGSGFVKASIVNIGTQGLATQYVSGGELMAVVPASYLQAVGSLQIQVFNPAPGGGYSTIQSVPVQGSGGAETTPDASDADAGGGSAQATFVVTAPGNPVPYLVPQAFGAGQIPTATTDQKLTFEGHNFIAATQIRFDGKPLTTTVATSTLTATVPAALLAGPGVHSIDAFNPGPGGGASNVLTLTVIQSVPQPAIAALDPPEVRTGSSDAWVIVKGTGFLPWSTVTVAGKAHPYVTYKNDKEIVVMILAASLKTTATLPIVVTNPDTPAKVSVTADFKVVNTGNGLPFLNTLSPVSAAKGASSVKITGTGGAMLAGARVWIDGVPRQTLTTAATSFTQTLFSSDVNTAGTFQVSIQNPPPGGGFAIPKTFTVTGSNPAPIVTALAPTSVGAGTGNLTLKLTMTGWVSKTVVQFTVAGKTWPLPCATATSTYCDVTIPAALLAVPGAASVKVVNPPTGGGSSAALTFTVELGLPTPQVFGVGPALLKLGVSGQKLTINGNGFVPQTVVTETTTGTVLPFQAMTSEGGTLFYLDVAVPDALVANAGTLQIQVSNPATGAPAKGGGTTKLWAVQVKPQPIVTSFSPASTKAGVVVNALKILGNYLNVSPSIQVIFTIEGVGEGNTFYASGKPISATELEVNVPVGVTAKAGVVKVVVQPEGFLASPVANWTVVP